MLLQVPPGGSETVGALAVAAVLAVVKSWYNGKLRNFLDARKAQAPSRRRLERKVDAIDTTATKTERQVRAIRVAIFLLHRDDDNVNEEALRARLTLESLEGDILTPATADNLHTDQDRETDGAEE